MVLEYQFPYGTMRVDAELFFRDADMARIRKLLKDYRKRLYGTSEELLIRWLKEKSDRLQTQISVVRSDYCMLVTTVSELDQRYQEMQNPCYAVYTRDREQLGKAREELRAKKQEAEEKKRRLLGLQRQETKFQKILEIVRDMQKE